MNKTDFIIIYFAIFFVSNCVSTSNYESTKLYIPMKTIKESHVIDIESDGTSSINFLEENQLKNHFEASKNSNQDFLTESSSKKRIKTNVENPLYKPTFSDNNDYVKPKDLEGMLNKNRDHTKQYPEFRNFNRNIQKIIFQDGTYETDLENARLYFVPNEDQKRTKFCKIFMVIFVVCLNSIFVLIAYYLKFSQKELCLVGFIVINSTFLQLFAVLK